jgi:chemotaxis protein CheC
MRVDLASLERFNRVGTDGAVEAADALATLTAAETDVQTTKINFAPVASLSALFEPVETAVAIEFDGGLEGRALLVFDAASAEYVRSNLVGVDTEPDPASLEEVANIMTSSFVDGWAAHVPETIDISTPTPVEDRPDPAPDDADEPFRFVFQSDIAFADADHACRFYLVPEQESFLGALRESGDGTRDAAVSLGELTTFIRLTAAGAETVATNLAAMTGIETDVAVSHLDFVPVEDLPTRVGVEAHAGTVFQLTGTMDGYLAVLFGSSGADAVAEALVPGDAPADAMRQSAIEEIGNVTASGFVDGWANALGTTIDHTVPEFVDDMGRAVLESLAAELGRSQSFAYVFDVEITSEEPLNCRMFAIPEADSFRSLVGRLDEDLDVSSVERV